ncbi:glycosyl transferase [Vibrio sp. qd031]|uniref:glycosyltransferase n=1 Tax=Vibrio sp. qd031 TaxID=1603038 RepID=UPI000A0FFAA0|nr:glycosyltransferase [Vibrio sp. qd031]ORT51875.1 glycosyl transferase [Vibrio sp. qd031]
MKKKIAVIMSVYHQDSPIDFDQALQSIFEQTYRHFDIFLQVDGKIPEALKSVISKYESLQNVHVCYSEQNFGLAFQLNQAIERVFKQDKFGYIARMDADDICVAERFEQQVAFLSQHPDIAVLGTSVIEFDEDGHEFYKKMSASHNELKSNIIKRCPLNHPTVMFNLNKIEPQDLQYNNRLLNTQDYYLWVDLLCKGYLFSNLEKPLLRFRVNSLFHKRRGLKKLKNDFRSRIYALNKLHIHSLTNYFYIAALVVLRVSPTFIKKLAYSRLR